MDTECRIKGKGSNRYARQFKGQKHICEMSGFTGYESEMVKINGKWILKKYVDKDEISKS